VDKVGVFIADDYELVRYALRTLLEAEPDVVVVGEAGDAEHTIEGCRTARPAVLVLGLRMPVASGADVCRAVRSCSPETAVIVLSSSEDEDEVFGALDAGACGYILKDTTPERVVEAVRCVATGQSVFGSTVAERIAADHAHHGGHTDAHDLSEREVEVLKLMARGLSNKEIGRSLWIGESTVKTHVSHILHKLDSADRTQAVVAAVKRGLVSLSD
jgi:DNA-binding NarL/FixJ family response regulator